MSIEGEDHDPIEDDNHVLENMFKDDNKNTLTNDTFEDNNTNTLTNETFGTNVGFATKDDDYDEDDIEFIHDIPLLEKENMVLYKGSQSTLIFFVLLFVNLKVMNGISKITISHMLRFVIYIIIVYKK